MILLIVCCRRLISLIATYKPTQLKKSTQLTINNDEFETLNTLSLERTDCLKQPTPKIGKQREAKSWDDDKTPNRGEYVELNVSDRYREMKRAVSGNGERCCQRLNPAFEEDALRWSKRSNSHRSRCKKTDCWQFKRCFLPESAYFVSFFTEIELRKTPARYCFEKNWQVERQREGFERKMFHLNASC